MNRALVAASLVLALAAGLPAGADPLPELGSPLPAITQPLEIEAGQRWDREVTLPALAADQVPVLRLRARVNAGGGGCNYMLRVFVNDRPLRENWFTPRLLNKPPNFDPPGTEFHFSWWRGARTDYTANAWMTIFSTSPTLNWAGTGQDFDYVFALDGLVKGGKVRLGLQHTWGGLPTALKLDRAPLLVEQAVWGTLPAAAVQAARDQVRAGGGLHPCPVEANVPAEEGPGERAYEVVWSGRPLPPAQVTFDKLAGWTASATGEAAVKLQASRAQRIWLPQNATLTIGQSPKPVAILLRPPKPITLSGPADAINLWAYGHMHFSVEAAKYSPLALTALLRDASGVEAEVDLGELRMQYWMLLHGLVPRDLKFPCQFLGLQIQCNQPKADYRIYLEALHCYAQNRKLKSFPRTANAVFPRNGEGMLPTPPAGVKTRLVPAQQAPRFVSDSPAGRLEVTVDPTRGCLEGVTMRWQSGPAVRPCAGGGLLTEDGKGPLAGKLLGCTGATDRVTARWEAPGGLKWEATYRLSGRTLIVDVRCPGGRAAGLDFGAITGLPQPRGVEVPYLNLAAGIASPRVAVGGGVFLSVLPDIYNSDRSHLNFAAGPAEGDTLRVLREAGYTPLTNGRRNDLRERLFLTLSPEFADVLPNHQNPRSPNLERLAPYMFVMDRASSLERWRAFKRYGLDHVIANDFAGVFVKSYSEGFGCRWRPHPDYTIAQVQDWRRQIKGLGYLFGAYVDVTDYYPLNEFWNESRVSLTADGDLADAWPGSFMPKTDFLRPLTEMVGRKVRENYPPDCVYLDVSTNRGNVAMDFEAGSPGAGTARAMVEGIGDSLVEARKWYGSTVSEGIFRWMYVGLSDMDYAQVHMSPGTMPVPLDFDLLKLHPYQIGTMMGWGPSNFLSDDEVKEMNAWGALPGPQPFYKYVGTSLAYGHSALLGYGYFPPMQVIMQYYALMQGLQSEYLPDTVQTIEYHDGQRFLPTSAALQADAAKRGRVRVTYRRGLTMTVNLNPTEPWTVAQDGQTYELPPYGWVAGKPGSILAYSALVEGKRLDYVDCPAYTYLNTGAECRRVGPLEVQGAAWLKKDATGWRVLPCGKLGYWTAQLTLTKPPADRGCPVLIVEAKGLAQVTAVNDEGAAVATTAETLPDGRRQLHPTAETLEFRLRK